MPGRSQHAAGQDGEAEQLTLFEIPGGPDMAKLQERRRDLAGRAGADATERAYAADWKRFLAWAKAAGRKAVPCSTETLELYVVGMGDEGRTLATIQRAVTAIRAVHKRLESPMPGTAGVRKLLLEMGRAGQARQPIGKAALTVDDLSKLLAEVDQTTEKGKRDRALLLLGFCGGLRRSELAGLQVADVVEAGGGLEVTVRRGKTDQVGRGRVVPIWKGPGGLCPVRAWRAWIRARGGAAGAAFLSWRGEIRQNRGITGDGIHDLVRTLAAAAGLDPDRFGAHSLRAGMVTAALQAGAAVPQVMAITGHRSVGTLTGYYRPGHAWEARNPLGKALKG